MGDNFAFVITDADGVILGLPGAQPFNLEDAGAGTCLIWSLAFDDDFVVPMVGDTAGNLTGCFDLSNPLTVVRNVGDDCVSSTVSPAADRLNVFPNPFGDNLTLEVDGLRGNNTELTLLDVTGRIVLRQKLVTRNGRTELSTVNLRAGTYLLRLANDAGVSTVRLIRR